LGGLSIHSSSLSFPYPFPSLLLPPPKKGGYVFFCYVCLSVCLFVYLLNYSKSYERILTKFFVGWGVAQGTIDEISVAIQIALVTIPIREFLTGFLFTIAISIDS